VVNKICETGIERKVDRQFWTNIYKYSTAYMSTAMDGWITVFFPYLVDERGPIPNDALMNADFKNLKYDDVEITTIPKGVSKVPLSVIDKEGKQHEMTIFGGFLGAQVKDKEEVIKPAYFWCVAHSK